jgi:hypothetical protein
MIGTISFLNAIKKFRTFKTQLSADKIMANVFWDSEGVIHVDFHPHGVTINTIQYLASQGRAPSDSEEKTWETVKEGHPTT